MAYKASQVATDPRLFLLVERLLFSPACFLYKVSRYWVRSQSAVGRGNLALLCVSQPLVQAQGLAVELEGAVTLALGFVMGFKIVPCRSGGFPRVCA